ncbi:glycogen synthase GlgA [Roseospirillum parvum]|uniref:Glycogen synthase n=1 Tax=Roseospirillum parvum TaxID=83401 RepID=A0A1G7VA30_9PROT|nr:glycogen synthase GlgA [Roseospirillum parvum]SDG56574.1 starch synthase [Roseospirillum parvum]
MRVLSVTSELHPLIKTGGLADVAGALPRALVHRGDDVRCLLPAYPGIAAALEPAGPPRPIAPPLPGLGDCRLIGGYLGPVRVELFDCPALFDRPGGPYVDAQGNDHPDNFHRFAALSRVGAELALGRLVPGWRADVVHTHDWPTGLVGAYLHFAAGPSERPAVVFTIHNIDYLGLCGPEVLGMIDLPDSAFSINGVEFNGYVSYLKAGCYHADHVTTVSPTYAREIQTPGGGRGLDGLLAGMAAEGRLSGILNGIDAEEWNPAQDGHLMARYDLDHMAGKATCKADLQDELGLEPAPNAPLFGLVSRLIPQKGVDLVIGAASEIIARGGQLAILGSGDPGLVEALHHLTAAHPGRVGTFIGYGEALAHRIQAGADLFLAPSRFEPCGLTQLYALRYGTLPVVRRTGGLADTVEDATPDGSDGTGFVFDEPSVSGIMSAIDRALALYGRPQSWAQVRRRAMTRDFGWDRAAEGYQRLFTRLCEQTARHGGGGGDFTPRAAAAEAP